MEVVRFDWLLGWEGLALYLLIALCLVGYISLRRAKRR